MRHKTPTLLPTPKTDQTGMLESSSDRLLRQANVPRLIESAGPAAKARFIEYFTARIRNRNTRAAYLRAVQQFLAWCDVCSLQLTTLTPVHVAGYVEQLATVQSKATAKQHLAAIRQCFDCLVTGGVLPYNPAAAVRGPAVVVRKGKTPVLTGDDARELIDAVDTTTLVGLRDRALIGVMIYSFARVGATVAMNVEDYYHFGRRSYLRLHEKGGKFHELPAHHKAQEFLDAYLSRLKCDEKSAPLFQTAEGRTGRLTGRRMTRSDALRMVKRRAAQVGLPDRISCHTFRATGITAYMRAGGSLECAQQMAAHESPRTTKLYDRTSDEVSLDEIERIVL